MKRSVTCTLAGAAFAAVLALGAAVGPALAYLTTYTSASGGVDVAVGPKVEPNEDTDGLKKTITLKNTGENSCFVRVKIFYSTVAATLQEPVTGNGWIKDDSLKDCECWEYTSVLEPENVTNPLTLEFTVKDDYDNNFNVVVVEEYVPALYDEDGEPYADWTLSVKTGEDSVSGEGEGGGES